MRRSSTPYLALLLTLVSLSAAEGQTLERPPRSVDGIFDGRRTSEPNRTSEELSLSLDLIGGYDDNVSPGGQDAEGMVAPQIGSYVGTASGELNYWRGNVRRSFDASGQGYVNTYSALEIRPQVGGYASLDGTTSIGQRTALSGSAGVWYQPAFLAGAFGSIDGDVEGGVIPGVGTTDVLSEERWLQTQASAEMAYSWTTRQTTAISYNFTDRQPTGAATLLQSRSHGAELQHHWRVARAASIRLAYEYENDISSESSGLVIPLRGQTVQAGVDLTRRLSRTRTFLLSVGAGATQTRTPPIVDLLAVDYTTPTFYVVLRGDLGRTWAVSANVRREVTALYGVSPQPFVAHVGSLNVGGSMGRRFNAGISAAYSDGVARDGQTGSYEILSAMGQLRYDMSRCCSLLVSYSYYQDRVLDVAAVPPGYPSGYDRNALRSGLSVRLPLHSTSRTE